MGCMCKCRSIILKRRYPVHIQGNHVTDSRPPPAPPLPSTNWISFLHQFASIGYTWAASTSSPTRVPRQTLRVSTLQCHVQMPLVEQGMAILHTCMTTNRSMNNGMRGNYYSTHKQDNTLELHYSPNHEYQVKNLS
jgi:hypothetical protein